jgi:hypothetical protein
LKHFVRILKLLSKCTKVRRFNINWMISIERLMPLNIVTEKASESR